MRDLYELAGTVLELVVDHFEVHDQPVPERRFVADGPEPAWDCTFMAVAVEQLLLHSGNVGAQETGPVQCLRLGAADLGVWVVRCAPVLDDDGNPPTVAAMSGSAETVLADPQLITDAVINASMLGIDLPRHGLSMRGWQPRGPAGGYTGGVLRIRVDLST